MEEWLRRCPLALPSYAVRRGSEGELSVTIDATWHFPSSSSPHHPPPSALTSAPSTESALDATPPSALPSVPSLPASPASTPRPAPVLSPSSPLTAGSAPTTDLNAPSVQALLKQMSSLRSTASPSPLPDESSSPSSSALAAPCSRSTEGPGGVGAAAGVGDALMAIMAMRAQARADGVDCSGGGEGGGVSSNPEAVRALLGQSLGTRFPKPPGYSHQKQPPSSRQPAAYQDAAPLNASPVAFPQASGLTEESPQSTCVSASCATHPATGAKDPQKR